MNPPHWSEERYWLDGQDKYQQWIAAGQQGIMLDIPAIQAQIYEGDGPAYKLLNAMLSVDHHESMKAWKGVRGHLGSY